eukprot:Skav225335  [mRNA]  locus=scaffold748:311374:313047:- [translate_table: standard]
MRIFARAVERHDKLVKEITDRFGFDGADVDQVLQWLCPCKNLHYRFIDRHEAEEVLRGVSSRVVLATFWLNDTGWESFSAFFRFHPDSVLQARSLRGSFSRGRRKGHAVVITGQSDEAWFIKNSWGEGFADDGYFRVAKNAIDFWFYDVCFRACDLSRYEISAYRLAPAKLEVTLVHPDRSERNPISSLGWEIDFETMRIERVRKRNCSIAHWNRENPFKKIHPGYQIASVNGLEDRNGIIYELQHSHELQLSLTIMNGFAKLDDVLHERARQFSYAHSVATAIRNTQARIFTRTVELHDDIVDEIVTRWGTTDVDMNAVLQDACGRRGIHYWCLTMREAAREVSRRGGREILATFSLDASAWNRFAQFFTDHPGSVLGRDDLQNDASLPQQAATVLICEVWHLSRQACWGVRDAWASSESPQMLYVSTDAIDFVFYDMYFYLSDLSSDEIRLFEQAPFILSVSVQREKWWVKGKESLGLSVNEDTLQVEWIAEWSPFEIQHNQRSDEVHRLYPGYYIWKVNGESDRVAILDRLYNEWALRIQFVKLKSTHGFELRW